MIGRMPTVLNTAMQINQASWLLRALFHMAIHFQTPSQMPSTPMTSANRTNENRGESKLLPIMAGV